jgi:GDP-4-dehydro-6-deoxy-D-mannose reductase
MKAVVTGISGFVGKHLAAHLQAAGDEVLGTVLHRPAAESVPPVVAWNVADPAPDDVRRRVAEFAPDVIYHLAAVSIPRDCGDAEPTAEAERTNVGGVGRVLELARSLVRRPRVVFTSSSHVYAEVDLATPLIAETHSLAPRNAYGRTKLAAERLCREAQAAGDLDIVIVRSFTQSGPGMDARLMLAEWAAQFVRGGEAPIEVVSLDVTIDFLDVRDSVRALPLLAERGAAGEAYNVGSGTPRTTGEILRLMREQAGDGRPVRELRPGRRSDPIADIGKLQAATGWSPQIPVERTIADVLEDWRRRA